MLDASRGVEVGQNQFDPLNMLRMNTTSITRFEEALQAAMLEVTDHSDCRSDKLYLSTVVVYQDMPFRHDRGAPVSLIVEKSVDGCSKNPPIKL